MKVKCPECNRLMKTEFGLYRYKESGLDNVYLENALIYKCNCGVLFPSIFRLPRLNELIAKTLIRKPTLLNGKEIRFIRKNMRLSSKDFAKRLGIGKTTLSKWENNTQRHRESYDRLIRALYLLYRGIKGKEERNFYRMFNQIQLRETNVTYIIIAEKEEDDYIINYKPVLGGQGEILPTVWKFAKRTIWAKSGLSNFAVEYSQTKSKKMFSSQELLSTGTVPILVGGC